MMSMHRSNRAQKLITDSLETSYSPAARVQRIPFERAAGLWRSASPDRTRACLREYFETWN